MRPKEKSNLILVEAAEEARVVIKATTIIAVVKKHRPTREEMKPTEVVQEMAAEAAKMTLATNAEGGGRGSDNRPQNAGGFRPTYPTRRSNQAVVEGIISDHDMVAKSRKNFAE